MGGAERKRAPALSVPDLYAKMKREIGLEDPRPVPYIIPSGSTALNRATYVGGYPGGRIIEIYGPEHSGKTTLAMHACVEAEKMGLPFAYIDMETTLDLNYFANMGLKGRPNVDWMHITPETGEDVFSVIGQAIDNGIKLIVVDSVAAMTPKAEIEGEMGEAFMGLQARMMGQGMRKSVGPVSRADATVIFINQVRMKIGVVFGNPETTPGGGALKFYSSIRLDIRQVGDPIQDESGEPIGKYSRVKVVKNKVAPPMRQCQIPILWGRGIAEEYELFDELVTQGIMTKTSSYFTYRGQKVNGRVNALAMVRERMAEMRADLDAKMARSESIQDRVVPIARSDQRSAAEIALSGGGSDGPEEA